MQTELNSQLTNGPLEASGIGNGYLHATAADSRELRKASMALDNSYVTSRTPQSYHIVISESLEPAAWPW